MKSSRPSSKRSPSNLCGHIKRLLGQHGYQEIRRNFRESLGFIITIAAAELVTYLIFSLQRLAGSQSTFMANLEMAIHACIVIIGLLIPPIRLLLKQAKSIAKELKNIQRIWNDG